ncbi:hypothetical protein BAE44_0019077 [Dichanthelium oligosanthes]|uniref:Bacterial surface antigen (D15) domain-containing protein n=1 Tax=Dichanthelium oligosanthes TaxID=888268 RepID=A0A1E5V4D6_9POAL|nr:hypothetical protein BAE44_0019077 [Dichanthelium oligosanthes]
MATASDSSPPPSPVTHDHDEDEDGEFDDDEVDEEEDDGEPSASPSEEARLEAVLRRLTADEVRIRVHQVAIRGYDRTRRAAVEAAVGTDLARAATVRDLVRAAAAAGDRLRRLGAFDTVSITLDAAPPGIPGTAVVVLVDVAEARGRAAAEIGVFANTQTRSSSLEGSLKLKNLFGYCETWDAAGALELDQTAELSAGVEMPRIGAMPTPLMARISFLSEDWLKSSLKEHLMGISVGLLSTMNHSLAYNLTWRKLTDPARMSSNSVQEQLGHSLLSSIKYAYKVDQRDSSIRPTCGYAFLSSSQVGGLAPGCKYSRFLRQELDLRAALPLGVLNGALNAGVAAGVIHPLERASTGSISPLSERFYLGGNKSLVCRLGGPSSLLGFKTRGLGATEFRTCDPNYSENGASSSPELAGLGGDIAVTAFADLSFDIPLKPLKDLGIHGHAFVCAGNLGKLTECDLWKFPLANFLQTFRSSAGFGVVVPTRLFRIELPGSCPILMLQPQYEEYLQKNGIFYALPVLLEAKHLKLGMEEARSFSLEGSLKLKNIFGYWETWDASVALELDETVELSAGVQMPRIGAMPIPLMVWISFLSGDCLKSSLKEHLMGVSVGLLSTMNHNLAYNLAWRTLTDPARMSSNSIQEQLGHGLLSSIKYAYKVDQRDSSIRPTRGYAFLSSYQVGCLAPGSKYSQYLKQVYLDFLSIHPLLSLKTRSRFKLKHIFLIVYQEIDLRVALPLGVLNGALNAGVAAGVIRLLGRGSTGSVLPVSERFYLGGNRSLVCCLGGPSSLSGFKAIGLEPRDFRACGPNNSENGASTSPGLDGRGDIAVTAFADLSFDLPLKPLKELGIHGHAFISAGNIAKLTEHDLRKFPLSDFLQTFRSSAGFGVVVPTRLFRIEMNYCYILKQFGDDRGKTGIQFNFSSP